MNNISIWPNHANTIAFLTIWLKGGRYLESSFKVAWWPCFWPHTTNVRDISKANILKIELLTWTLKWWRRKTMDDRLFLPTNIHNFSTSLAVIIKVMIVYIKHTYTHWFRAEIISRIMNIESFAQIYLVKGDNLTN